MNVDFQQAIEMTRSGDRVGAQKKVAEMLKDDPNNAHAWYLLSLIVDSDQKRAVYLSKAVSLDPNHEKAIAQLSRLEQTSSIPITSGNNIDLIDQEKAGTIPDWMSDAGAPAIETEISTLPDSQEQNEEEDVPDWVQEDVSTSWVEEDNSIATAPPTEVVAEKATPPPAKKKKPAKKKANDKQAAKRKKQAQNYNIALVGLIVLAVIVGFMLIYILFF